MSELAIYSLPTRSHLRRIWHTTFWLRNPIWDAEGPVFFLHPASGWDLIAKAAKSLKLTARSANERASNEADDG